MSSFNNKLKLNENHITKNLTYISENPINIDKNTFKFKNIKNERPLLLLFSWMLATKEQLQKYIEIYTNLGFDAVTIAIKPWQLLWPVSGAQLIASDVLKFLHANNSSFNEIVIHGFSVGGYMFGEVMVHMSNDIYKYETLIKKFSAQIWDSAADITDIPIGFPMAVFPNQKFLQKTFRNYLYFHLKTFHEKATIHYKKSSKIYHNTIIKAPALFLLSKNDPIGTEKSNLTVKNDWESLGIDCTWKCWDKSKHVLHYKYYKDEYFALVMEHLYKNLKFLNNQNINLKLKAKL